MFRLLRDDCFFINHHHHFRIGLPTMHFRHPYLTQFCLSLFELWLVSPKVFRLLRDRAFNSDTMYSPSYPSTTITHFDRVSTNTSATTTSFRYHHLTFSFGDFEFAGFSFPKVFRLIRNRSTSLAIAPLYTKVFAGFPFPKVFPKVFPFDTIVYSPCNCIVNP